MVKTMKIELGANGLGTLSIGGKTFSCGGKAGMKYPSDLTIDPAVPGTKQELHLSREFGNARMPWAILIVGQRGIDIHEWPCLGNSSGCIHLLKGDAKEVYDAFSEKTRVLIAVSESADDD